MKGFQKIGGISMKVRTYSDDGGEWIAAFVAIDGTPMHELGRRSMIVEVAPGSEEHQAWVAAMRDIFRAFLVQATGEEGIRTKLQAPSYKGE